MFQCEAQTDEKPQHDFCTINTQTPAQTESKGANPDVQLLMHRLV